MLPPLVIKLPPLLNQHLGFASTGEPLPVQAFVTQFAVEAFHKTVLPGTARLDIGRTDIVVTQPLHYCCCGKLAAIVQADEYQLP